MKKEYNRIRKEAPESTEEEDVFEGKADEIL